MPIDFRLSEEQELICRSVEEFARNELRARMRELEAAGGVDDGLRERFAEMGLDRLNLPESLDGLGADDRLRALINERLAWGDAGAAVALGALEPVILAIQELADDDQAAHWLGRVAAACDEGRWGCVASSEAAGAAPCRAEPVDGGYRLLGGKAFVANAGDAAVTVVLAEASDGPAAFVIEGQPEGLVVEPMPARTGLEATPLFELRFDNLPVDASQRLARGGQLPALRRFYGRASLQEAARAVGIMQASWTAARDYATEREAFGKPIAHFQAIAFMLSDMATLTDASRWSVWQAADAFDRGRPKAVREALVAVANAFDSVTRVTEDGVQILGGAGFVQDYPAEKWMRDARTLSLRYATGEQVVSALAHDLLGTADEAAADELLPAPPLQPVLT